MTECEQQARKIFDDWWLGTPGMDIELVNEKLRPLNFEVRIRRTTPAEVERFNRVMSGITDR